MLQSLLQTPLGAWIRDTAEKAVFTVVYSLVTFFTMADRLGATTTDVVAATGLTALAVFLRNAVAPPGHENPTLDIVTRVAWSSIQAAAVVGAADGFGWFDATSREAILAAAGFAALTTLKGVIATRMAKPTMTPASVESA